MLADSTTIGSITTGLRTFLWTGCVLAMTSGLAVRADSTLVADGQPRAAVFVSERVWDDATKKPEPIVEEINSRLYGHAGAAMSAYWRHIDDTWVKIPEYAGCGFGHLRRWNVEKLTDARRLMNAGRAACATDAETARVKFADDSLAAFEMLMQQRRDLADGRWSTLAGQVTAYRTRLIELGQQYEPQFAFTKMG